MSDRLGSQALTGTRLIAGLSAKRSNVRVGPPWAPSVPSLGSVLTRSKLGDAAARSQVFADSRLYEVVTALNVPSAPAPLTSAQFDATAPEPVLAARTVP